MQRRDVLCDNCGRRFDTVAAWKQHYQDTHEWESQRVKCTHGCERWFCDDTAMNTHRMHKHPDVRSTITTVILPEKELPFKCTECGRDYETLDQFHDHQTLAACQKPDGSHIYLADAPGSLKCEACDKVCADHISLEQHFVVNHAVIKLRTNDETKIEQERNFLAQWKNHNEARINIHSTFKIYNSAWRAARYEKYKSAIVANRREFGKSQDNEMFLYHGTSLTCQLGSEKQRAKLCNSIERKCNMCSILRQGFKQSKAASNRWQRFGPGIYTTSHCNKSDEYIVPREARRRAVFVCKVLTGRVFETEINIPNLTAPPPGFDSVMGRPGSHLNYNEYVVYDSKAILPAFIIVYTKDAPQPNVDSHYLRRRTNLILVKDSADPPVVVNTYGGSHRARVSYEVTVPTTSLQNLTLVEVWTLPYYVDSIASTSNLDRGKTVSPKKRWYQLLNTR